MSDKIEPLNMHGHANTWEEELQEVCAERDALRNNMERAVNILTPLFVKAQEADSPDEEVIGGALDVLTGWFGQNGRPMRRLDGLERERDALRAEVERWKTNAKKEREYSLLVEKDNEQLRTALTAISDLELEGGASLVNAMMLADEALNPTPA